MVKKIADKRIPVTEKTWKILHGLRNPGQTYSELIDEMITLLKKSRSL